MSSLSLNFLQTSLDKGTIKRLLTSVWRVYGLNVSIDTFDELKEIGFEYATYVGFSMSLGDLMIPPQKRWMMRAVTLQDELCEHRTELGLVTPIEQFQRLMDLWHLTSEALRNSIVDNFANTNTRNPVYTMAQSGARGSMSQVRQLVGMRGLMANPQGEVVEYPIRANFREGLTLAEFAISGYGGRKGLVDTAVRTADAGYLTRRLVDVAHVVIIRQLDCGTDWNIPLQNLLSSDGDLLIPIASRAMGRVIGSTVIQPFLFKDIGCYPNQTIDRHLINVLSTSNVKTLPIRSPLTCGMWSPYQETSAQKNQLQSICQLCYGWDYSEERMVDLNQAVGIIAAQSIGEPGTQLTMRTFHTGGVFEGTATKRIRSKDNGTISFDVPVQGSIIRTSYGNQAFLTYSPTLLRIKKEGNLPDEVFTIPSRSILYHRPGEIIHARQPIFEPNAKPGPQSRGRIIMSEQLYHSEVSGQVWWPKSKPIRKVAKQTGWSTLFRRYDSTEIAEIGDIQQHQLLGTTTTSLTRRFGSTTHPLRNHDWLELSNTKQNVGKNINQTQLIFPQTTNSDFLSLQTLSNPLQQYYSSLRPKSSFFNDILNKYKTFITQTQTLNFYSNQSYNQPQPRLRAFKSFIEPYKASNYQHRIKTLTNITSFAQNSVSQSGQLTGTLSMIESVWILEGLLVKFNAHSLPLNLSDVNDPQGSPDGLLRGFNIQANEIYTLDTFENEVQAVNISQLLPQLSEEKVIQKTISSKVKEPTQSKSTLFFTKLKQIATVNLQWWNWWKTNDQVYSFNPTTLSLKPETQTIVNYLQTFQQRDLKECNWVNFTSLMNKGCMGKMVNEQKTLQKFLVNQISDIDLKNGHNFEFKNVDNKNEYYDILINENHGSLAFVNYLDQYSQNLLTHNFSNSSNFSLPYTKEINTRVSVQNSLVSIKPFQVNIVNRFSFETNYRTTRSIVHPQTSLIVLSGQNPGWANNKPLPHWFAKSTVTPVVRKTQAQWGSADFWFGRNAGVAVSKLNTTCKTFSWVRQAKPRQFKTKLLQGGRSWQLKIKRSRLKTVFMRVARKNLNTCIKTCLSWNTEDTKLLLNLAQPLITGQSYSDDEQREIVRQLKPIIKKIWFQYVKNVNINRFILPSDLLLYFVNTELTKNIYSLQDQINLSTVFTIAQKQELLLELKNYARETKILTKSLDFVFTSRVDNYWLIFQDLFGYKETAPWRSNNHLGNTYKGLPITVVVRLQTALKNALKQYRKLQELNTSNFYSSFQNSKQNGYPFSPLGSNFISFSRQQRHQGRAGFCSFKAGSGQIIYGKGNGLTNLNQWGLVSQYPRLSFLPNPNEIIYSPSGVTVPQSNFLGFGITGLDNGVDLKGQRWVRYTDKKFDDLNNTQSIFRSKFARFEFSTTCNLCWLTPITEFSFSLNINSHNKFNPGTIYEKHYQIQPKECLPLSGQLIQISPTHFTMRPVTGYPVSRSRALFYLHHKNLVREGEPVYSYSYQRQRTGDIVQGIPVIESLFEGRVKRKGSYVIDNLRVPARDESVWQGISRGAGGGRSRIFEYTLAGLLGVRIALVNRIQATYLQQGVDFADKHVEVIVRRFTSQVHFKTGGGTRHLPSERVHELNAHSSAWLTSSTYSHRLKLCLVPTPKYLPSVTGLTKTALFAQSFLGSASFQESSKTFIRVGLKGAQNFLGGLKDQVITGRTLHFNSPTQGLNPKTLFIVSCPSTFVKVRKPKYPFILLPALRVSTELNLNYIYSEIPPINFLLTTHPCNWMLVLLNNSNSNLVTKINTTVPLCFPLWVQLPKYLGNGQALAAAVTPTNLTLNYQFAFQQKNVYNKTKELTVNQSARSGSLYFYKGIGLISF